MTAPRADAALAGRRGCGGGTINFFRARARRRGSPGAQKNAVAGRWAPGPPKAGVLRPDGKREPEYQNATAIPKVYRRGSAPAGETERETAHPARSSMIIRRRLRRRTFCSGRPAGGPAAPEGAAGEPPGVGGRSASQWQPGSVRAIFGRSSLFIPGGAAASGRSAALSQTCARLHLIARLQRRR